MLESFKWKLKWNHLPYRVVFEKGFEIEYEKGIKKALPFYEQAAKMGYAMAQYTLGTYYDELAENSAAKREKDKYSRIAFGYYEQAALQGYAPAQDALRVCYLHGGGCEKDKAKALYWCEKAAEQNYLPAMKNLLEMYSGGVGCRCDCLKSGTWKQRYETQRAQHPEWEPDQHPHSREAAMAQYRKTGIIPNSLDAAKCSPPPKDAAPVKSVPEAKPDPRPEPKPAPKPERKPQPAPKRAPAPKPTPRPTKKPAYSTKIETDVSDTAGAPEYMTGKGYYKQGDYVNACKYMGKAAAAGNRWAMYAFATMVEEGKGCTANGNIALYWYEKAAKKNVPAAQFYCAWYYFNGDCCEKDYERAIFWAEHAARQDVDDAQFLYGVMLFNGMGCTAKADEGILWLKKAAEKGHKDAIRLLEKL